MAQVIAQHGEDYALWGCVGAWFSNAWYSSPAQGYINTVQKDEASQLWLSPGRELTFTRRGSNVQRFEQPVGTA